MERKAKRKNRLFVLLVAMFVTVVGLTTSTYAWFTSNKKVSVSEIQVNVQAQGGIQVSADGSSWKSIVNVADLLGADATYAASINQIPTTLEPVSSGINVDAAGLMEMYYGTVQTNVGGDYILTAAKETEVRGTAGKFVAFDLFFRADIATDLYLTTNSGVETPDVTDTGIKNATRIGMVVLGNTAIGSTLPTIQALNSGVVSPTYVWEPNYNSHTAPAIANAFDTYGITVDTNAVPYSGVEAPIVVGDDVLLGDATELANPALFKAVNPIYKTVNGFTNQVQVFGLAKGITKIRFYMWVEGQDVDCENGASGGQATFNVQFTTEAI